jgi:hypothetical protein
MNWQTERSMTPEQYAWAIRRLGMNKAQAGRYLGISARTAYRYWDGDARIPAAHVLLLRGLIHHNETPAVPDWKSSKH